MTENTKKPSFPDRFFRGIPNNTFKNGILLSESFKLGEVREDGFCEISITWDDAPEALDILMSQISERTNDYQFKDGIAEINRKEFDEGMKPHIFNKHLSYERSPLEGNRYHGNLLVKNELDKQMKTLIKSQLAFLANKCIYPNKHCLAHNSMSMLATDIS